MVQRFGSALNLNLNFHILCLDGVYVRGADGLRFVPARQVTTEEVGALVVELATRAERWLSRQGFGPEDEEEPGVDNSLPLIQAASVQGRSAVSGGRRARRFQVHRGRAYTASPVRHVGRVHAARRHRGRRAGRWRPRAPAPVFGASRPRPHPAGGDPGRTHPSDFQAAVGGRHRGRDVHPA